ncbi:MAG: YlxR family protein [Armatimonadota bacterium]|nr:YlxR family protein [Armatimonadota bacterium]
MPRVRHVPQRQCVTCRQVRPKRELLRVVRTPTGEVRVDATGKVAGRGAYVCPSEACAESAVRDGRLQRALEVPIPEDVTAALRVAVAQAQRARTPGAQ